MPMQNRTQLYCFGIEKASLKKNYELYTHLTDHFTLGLYITFYKANKSCRACKNNSESLN